MTFRTLGIDMLTSHFRRLYDTISAQKNILFTFDPSCMNLLHGIMEWFLPTTTFWKKNFLQNVSRNRKHQNLHCICIYVYKHNVIASLRTRHDHHTHTTSLFTMSLLPASISSKETNYLYRQSARSVLPRINNPS